MARKKDPKKEKLLAVIDSIPPENFEVKAYYGDMIEHFDQWFTNKLDGVPVDALTMSVDELKKKIVINEQVATFREAFWLEFWKAKSEGRKIAISNVIDGICTKNMATTMMKNPYVVAYIYKPVMKYESRLNSILSEYGSKVVKEILDQPCVTEEGKFDTMLASLKLRTLKQLEDRLQGTPIQRSETKELKVNIAGEMSMDEINKRLQELGNQIPHINTEFREVKDDFSVKKDGR